jgi:hypothetical protein
VGLRFDAAFLESDAPRVGKSFRGEAGENFAGRQLDEQPDTELEEQAGGVVPADWPLDAAGQIGPGVTAGVESAGGTLRLVLSCTAFTSEEKPLGVVFTALISSRRPQVSVAPVEAYVPKGWQQLDDLP